mmetsp:Transcript_45398/g.89446  ORF Transcript_45398/g.89446 Transcript_45398/m.89446 type:complete len:747 (+) Transcript_45398:77-2317(+)
MKGFIIAVAVAALTTFAFILSRHADESSASIGRRLLSQGQIDPHILDQCVASTPPSDGFFDVLYVVHSKDLGSLRWGVKSILCRVTGIGRIWIVSDDAPAVHTVLKELNRDIGGDRISWHNEKDFPFSWSDVEKSLYGGPAHGQTGWYFQQLLKLYAGRTIDGIRDFMVVDADVVWYGRDITIVVAVDESGAPATYNYGTALQKHAGYFEHIQRLTKGEVTRVDTRFSGIVHHMVFKLDVLEALMRLCEKNPGDVFWKEVLKAVDPKIENTVSEYELYLNYALKFHPKTVRLRHLTFANGPKPGMVYNGGDEGKVGGAVWVAEAHGFEKQMVLDQRSGFDFVAYHNYARKRYYDVPLSSIDAYCQLGVGKRNTEMSKKCEVVREGGHRGGRSRKYQPQSRRLTATPDPHILDNCTSNSSSSEGLFDVLYVVHSKDLGPLRWGMRSLVCRVPGIGKIWVVSDDALPVHNLLRDLKAEMGSDRIGWYDEKDFPFSWGDVDHYMGCKKNCGWYLQQLLKLCAGRVIPGIRDYMVVDADLVWFGHDIKMISSTDALGKPTGYFYNTAAQNHRAYFDHIAKFTNKKVSRVDGKTSGVVHHMIFKLDVLEAMMKMCEESAGGDVFWKALLKSVDPKAFNSVSEYELYFNYALLYHPETITLRHITFANGPRPGLMSNGGDESSMRGVWGHVANGFEKQMAIDQRTGYDYVGYHSYAKRRYFDIPESAAGAYCDLGVGKKNVDMEKKCARIQN